MAEFDNNNQINNNNNFEKQITNNNEANNTTDYTANNAVENNASYRNPNDDINTTVSKGYKVPEYSFFAEELQANSQVVSNPVQSNVNTGNNQSESRAYYGQLNNNANPIYNQVHDNNVQRNYQSQGYNEQGNYQPQGNNEQGNYQPQGNNAQGNYQTQYSNNNVSNANNYYSSQYNTSNPYGNYYNQYNNTGNRGAKKVRKPGYGTKLLKFTGKAVCFGLIAGVGFFGFHKLYSVINPGVSVQNVMEAVSNQNSEYEIAYTQPASVKISDISTVSEVIDNNLPSIVSINSIQTQTDNWFGQSYEIPGSGSGIIVGRTEKEILVATNNHVVEGGEKITITFVDGKEADAIIKGTDVVADLAVVALNIEDISQETLDKITVAKLGNSDQVKVGEMAIAIGNALGYGQSTTVGYISAKDREVEVSDGYFNTKKMVLLQTDAAINPGNSGGALLNSKGEVIGINSVKYAKEEVEGMGFAIPISKATPIINELMSREILSPQEQGFLGITGGDVTEEDSKAYNMPVGVFVNELSEGGPAQKAGLQSGDIIIKVEDIKVTSISQLREYVNSRRVGTDVKVTYMRYTNGNYKEDTVTVTLGKNVNLTATE